MKRTAVRVVALGIAVTVAAGACGSGSGEFTATAEGGEQPPAPYAGYSSRVYDSADAWLCRPDVDGDACDIDLDAERIDADGSRQVEPFEPNAAPPVDCFYVYPTVSTDPGTNSDLVPGDGERLAAANQLARLATTCRLWAPVYEQVTLAGIAIGPTGGIATATTAPSAEPGNAPGTVSDRSPSQVAYDGVLDAFRHYMANHNDGRGVVLIGHSQGTGHLRRLVAEEIDPDPLLRQQLVSAVLLGLSVPEDPTDGGFANVPPCRSATEVGCHLAWASYRATDPPGTTGLFARPTASGGRSTCTNPGDLGGTAGRVPLRSYFTAEQSPQGRGWLADGSAPRAPWVLLAGLVEAECVERDGYHYLEITLVPDSVRTPDVPGDLPGGWGLHLIDANLAMGELVEIVSTQSAAWVSAN